jgi:predicted AlkP superfamily pyrophosphatase or phosphodiesterase
MTLSLLVLGAFRMSKSSNPPTAQVAILSNGTSNFAQTTILISLDGFRADFLNRGLTPTLNSFITEGVSPLYMLPSFPSVTFPNHYTLVTGLFPESHGIVGNSFWDPDMGKEFFYTDPTRSMQPEWWAEAEPLWATAAKQGVDSAIHMWPGSEAGIQPAATFLDKYNGTEILSRKVDRVFQFLDLPSKHDPGMESLNGTDARPQFIAFYVPNVDADGHLYGPNSTEIRTTISNVDSMLHNLFAGLQQRNLTDIVNVVVVSDHGMATTSNDRIIQLDDLINLSTFHPSDGWPLHGLRPKNPYYDVHQTYDKLLIKQKENPNFNVYLRDENMPERYHFKNNKRIAPLWIVPKTGWAIVEKSKFDIEKAKETGQIYRPRGLHGYDNEDPLMRAIFIARGPAFPHQPNSRVDVFREFPPPRPRRGNSAYSCNLQPYPHFPISPFA